MQSLLERIWREDRGVLTFEWVLLITVLVIGIVGGYSAVRDALVDEMGDIADAALAVDQSFSTTAPAGHPELGSWGSFDDDHPPIEVTRGRRTE